MSTPRIAQTAIHQPWPGVIAAYRDRLPVGDDWTAVTLLEGGTPLITAPRLSEKTGCTIYLKVEGLNPTGSFKDRGMTMAVTDAVARGQQAVLCASTGNTSASAAAYAARAGITCAVLIPQGKIAMGKLAQAVMHGAKIIQIDGNFDDCLELGPQDGRRLPGHLLGQLGQSGANRGSENGGVRDRGRVGRRTRRARPAGRQRREHHRLLEGLHRVPPRRRDRQTASYAGHSGRRRGALGTWPTGKSPGDHRHRDSHRRPSVVDGRPSRPSNNPRDASWLPPTRRSWPHTISWPAPKASSSNPHPRPASRACSSPSTTAGLPVGRRWCAR